MKAGAAGHETGSRRMKAGAAGRRPSGASRAPGSDGPRGPAALRAFVEKELGDPSVAVEADGPEGEIAVLRVPAALLAPLLEPGLREEVVRRARQAGFRYAAVELTGT